MGPVAPPTPVAVFCYGALLASSTRQRRGVAPVQGSTPVRGVLPGHRLDFNHRAGYGNVVACPKPGGSADGDCAWYEVHGIVLTMSQADADRLKTAEIGYRPKEVDVVVYPEDATEACGATVRACTFFSDPWSTVLGSKLDLDAFQPLRVTRAGAGPADGLPPPLNVGALPPAYLLPSVDDLSLLPTARYLGLLRAGANEVGLDAGYVAWLCEIVAPLDPAHAAAADGARYDTQGRSFARMLAFIAVASILLWREL